MRNRLSTYFTRLTMPDAAGIIVALVFTLAFWLCVISPLNSRSQRNSAQLQTIARERQRYAGVLTSLKRVGDNVSQMQATLKTSSLHLLPKDALNRRLADLAAVAGDSGLTIKDIKPSDTVDQNRFEIVPIHMTGRGTYPICTFFIHQLHEKFPDLSVSRLRLSASQEDTAGGCDFDIEMRWLTVPTGTNNELPHLASIN